MLPLLFLSFINFFPLKTSFSLHYLLFPAIFFSNYLFSLLCQNKTKYYLYLQFLVVPRGCSITETHSDAFLKKLLNSGNLQFKAYRNPFIVAGRSHSPSDDNNVQSIFFICLFLFLGTKSNPPRSDLPFIPQHRSLPLQMKLNSFKAIYTYMNSFSLIPCLIITNKHYLRCLEVIKWKTI